jgi:hypothetical protein
MADIQTQAIMARSAATIISSLKDLVSKKKVARELVEELRALSYHMPANVLFEILFGALQLYKSKKLLSEENKAVKGIYLYMSQLASQSLLTLEQASILSIQLKTIDIQSEFLPRSLSALILYSQLTTRFPHAETSLQFEAILQPFLVEASEALEEFMLQILTKKKPQLSLFKFTSGSSIKKAQADALFSAPSVFAALMFVCGTDVEPEELLPHLRTGLTCVTREYDDVVRCAAAGLYRAALRVSGLVASTQPISDNSSGFGTPQRGAGASTQSRQPARRSSVSTFYSSGQGARPNSLRQLQGILIGTAPRPWSARPASSADPNDPFVVSRAFSTNDEAACVFFLRAAAVLSGIKGLLHKQVLARDMWASPSKVSFELGGATGEASALLSELGSSLFEKEFFIKSVRARASAISLRPSLESSEFGNGGAACYEVILSALADARWRVRLEAARLLLFGGLPRLLQQAAAESVQQPSSFSSSLNLQDKVTAALRPLDQIASTINEAISAALSTRSSALLFTAIRVALAFGAAFSLFEAQLMASLRSWLAGLPVTASRKQTHDAFRPNKFTAPPIAPGMRPAVPAHIVEQLLVWSGISKQLCLILDSLVRCLLVADTGHAKMFTGIPSLAMKAIIWCVPSAVLAVPNRIGGLFPVSDEMFESEFCCALFGHSFASAALLEIFLQPFGDDVSFLLHAQRAVFSVLSDAPERLDGQSAQLRALFSCLADRALQYHIVGGPVVSTLMVALPLVWFDRLCGDYKEAVSSSATTSLVSPFGADREKASSAATSQGQRIQQRQTTASLRKGLQSLAAIRALTPGQALKVAGFRSSHGSGLVLRNVPAMKPRASGPDLSLVVASWDLLLAIQETNSQLVPSGDLLRFVRSSVLAPVSASASKQLAPAPAQTLSFDTIFDQPPTPIAQSPTVKPCLSYVTVLQLVLQRVLLDTPAFPVAMSVSFVQALNRMSKGISSSVPIASFSNKHGILSASQVLLPPLGCHPSSVATVFGHIQPWLASSIPVHLRRTSLQSLAAFYYRSTLVSSSNMPAQAIISQPKPDIITPFDSDVDLFAAPVASTTDFVSDKKLAMNHLEFVCAV